MQRLFIVFFCLALGACAVKPETRTPTLEPVEGGAFWPSPPDPPRYAFAGALVGEHDFIVPDNETKKDKGFFSGLASFFVGEPDYLELQRPSNGLVDSRGRIIVTDMGLQAVVVFDMQAQKVYQWKMAGRGLNFVAPIAICEDGRGGFYVTDSELGQVYHLSPNGVPMGRFGRDILKRPTGITRNTIDGRIYVTDTAAHDIKVFDRDHDLIDTIGGRGTESGLFNAPTHLDFKDGRLYVADTLNFRVQVFDASENAKLTFGEIGAYVGNMTRPKGVAAGVDGRIYAVESFYDHLLIYNSQGQLLMTIGGTGKAIGQFYLPSGVWTHADKVYVADMFNGRIMVFKDLTGGSL